MFLLKSLLLSFSLLPVSWAELDFNIFQVIYCDVDQVLEITNRTSSTMCIENDSQSFIGDSSNQPNGDNS